MPSTATAPPNAANPFRKASRKGPRDPSAALGITKGEVVARQKAFFPTQVTKNVSVPTTNIQSTATLSFVIPSEAEGSAVAWTFRGNADSYPQIELSSRLPRRAAGPERTRISCRTALDTTACVAFSKESRMKIANATNTNRKSGVAEWRDLRFPFPAGTEYLPKSNRTVPKGRLKTTPDGVTNKLTAYPYQ